MSSNAQLVTAPSVPDLTDCYSVQLSALSVCMYVSMHVCVYMHVCMYLCMYACLYVCMHVKFQLQIIYFYGANSTIQQVVIKVALHTTTDIDK